MCRAEEKVGKLLPYVTKRAFKILFRKTGDE